MSLSPRQSEIAEMVARGLSNKAIARETGLSVRTVEDHIANAAARIPGTGTPRYKLIVFVFRVEDSDSVA